jgi:ferredoxin
MSSLLRVNPITCEAHGLCAELFPERVTLDDWGYPIIDPEPITPELQEHARRAVKACPTFALALPRSSASERSPSQRPRVSP